MRAVDIVESAYVIEGDERSWLRGLVREAMPLMDRGFGVFAASFLPGAAAPEIAELVLMGDPAMAALLERHHEAAGPVVWSAFMSQTDFGTLRQILAALGPEHLVTWERVAAGTGIVDAAGVRVHDLERGAVNIAAASPRVVVASRADRRAWSQVAAHIGTALRLRRRAATADPRVEAILSPKGRIEHAEGEARSADARERLSEGLRGIRHARGPGRASADALDHWPTLVAGRWTLVDTRDRDGKQLVRASVNEPQPDGLDDLAPRERAIVELVRRGHGNKQIAYVLGISVGTVSSYLSHAMRKIGAKNRVQLVTLTERPSPSVVAAALRDATAAEREVAAMLVEGLSDRAIAERRGVSARTVANQLRSLFARCGVRSRAELAVHLRQRAREIAAAGSA